MAVFGEASGKAKAKQNSSKNYDVRRNCGKLFNLQINKKQRLNCQVAVYCHCHCRCSPSWSWRWSLQQNLLAELGHSRQTRSARSADTEIVAETTLAGWLLITVIFSDILASGPGKTSFPHDPA